MMDTPAGALCVCDSGGDGPVLVLPTASPCVTAHYAELVRALRDEYRVIVFDMPGFGFSPPRKDYGHSLREGGAAIAGLLEALAVTEVTLVAGSLNGLYALSAAAQTPRVTQLVLVQTPSVDAMKAWFDRITQPALRRPLFGQFINFVSRVRFPPLWFRIVVADAQQREHFTRTALAAFEQGACYCFASCVQGLLPLDPADSLLAADPALPVALVWGGTDRTHRSTKPDAILAHAPQTELTWLPGVGHYADLDDPEGFALLLRNRVPPTTPESA